MRPALKTQFPTCQLQIGLVNQRGALQRMVAPLAGNQFARTRSQLVVDERQQLRGRATLASVNGVEQLRYAVG
jgi:hypothetical protein